MYSEIDAESKKLEKMIATPYTQDISSIIQTYHTALNISSMIKAIKIQEPAQDTIQIQNILNEFNSGMHKETMQFLDDSIKQKTLDLQNITDAQQDSKSFDELREMMSTLEFVKQYNSEIQS